MYKRLLIVLLSTIIGSILFAMVKDTVTEVEYVKSDNLCGMQPIFLGKKEGKKYLVSFSGKKQVCFRKVDADTEYIAVDDDFVTLYDHEKKKTQSFDKITYEKVTGYAKYTDPIISYDEGEYIYEYFVDGVEHTGTYKIRQEELELLDVN